MDDGFSLLLMLNTGGLHPQWPGIQYCLMAIIFLDTTMNSTRHALIFQLRFWKGIIYRDFLMDNGSCYLLTWRPHQKRDCDKRNTNYHRENNKMFSSHFLDLQTMVIYCYILFYTVTHIYIYIYCYCFSSLPFHYLSPLHFPSGATSPASPTDGQKWERILSSAIEEPRMQTRTRTVRLVGWMGCSDCLACLGCLLHWLVSVMVWHCIRYHQIMLFEILFFLLQEQQIEKAICTFPTKLTMFAFVTPWWVHK